MRDPIKDKVNKILENESTAIGPVQSLVKALTSAAKSNEQKSNGTGNDSIVAQSILHYDNNSMDHEQFVEALKRVVGMLLPKSPFEIDERGNSGNKVAYTKVSLYDPSVRMINLLISSRSDDDNIGHILGSVAGKFNHRINIFVYPLR